MRVLLSRKDTTFLHTTTSKEREKLYQKKESRGSPFSSDLVGEFIP
jgi:hypothetical protein